MRYAPALALLALLACLPAVRAQGDGEPAAAAEAAVDTETDSGIAAEAAGSRTFTAQNCRITLPDGGSWNDDIELLPGTLADYSVGDEAIIIVLAIPTDPPTPLTSEWIRHFEDNYMKDNDLQRVGGRHGTFRDIPCFDSMLGVRDSDRVIRIRIFNTQTHSYQISVVGGIELLGVSPVAERYFDTFAFLEPPVSATPIEANSAPEIVAVEPPRSTPWFVIIILALGLLVAIAAILAKRRELAAK